MIAPSGTLRQKRIVITRAAAQASDLIRLIQERNGVPLSYPCIDFEPCDNLALLDGALLHQCHFNWLIFTSVNAVRIVAERLAELRVSLGNLKIAAVGPATAAFVRATLGREPHLIPETYSASGLVSAIPNIDVARILLPQSADADPILARQLAARGAQVLAVTAYRTIVGTGGVNLPRLLLAGEVDAITFTSGTTVDGFFTRLKNDGGCKCDLAGVTIACLGNSAVKAARHRGLMVRVRAESNTMPNLISELERYFNAA